MKYRAIITTHHNIMKKDIEHHMVLPKDGHLMLHSHTFDRFLTLNINTITSVLKLMELKNSKYVQGYYNSNFTHPLQ